MDEVTPAGEPANPIDLHRKLLAAKAKVEVLAADRDAAMSRHALAKRAEEDAASEFGLAVLDAHCGPRGGHKIRRIDVTIDSRVYQVHDRYVGDTLRAEVDERPVVKLD